ncbi:hypothetical protein NG895_06745 [Aeoliella sp. ICT_H6.2]|uniref:Glycosyl hydrolase family 32 N-terminal domain-containing protein n=1 Tax=Aeoliella straminimaris TaxID=2954799 RepID=A0A9X2JF22_9BACT|nr:hypothetical protein [Aeoliella straminimaris]MCO6043600.1 hypothetical protein [Aeoliella straminimaris]
MRRNILLCLVVVLAAFMLGRAAVADEPVMLPYIDGPWWQVAGNPDLGEYTTDRQQPVDFAVWQAADGTWQLWSCIRKTACGGNTRLLAGWEADSITDSDWKSTGIRWMAEPKYGETPGGMQAPHVVQHNDQYHMLYGDWENICLATSKDGKNFERYVRPNGTTGLFSEGLGTNTRDIVALEHDGKWYGYYTAYPNRQGAVYCRTSDDLKHWSESTNVAFGGAAGVDPFAAECPHVVRKHGRFYLLRTQDYGISSRTSIYSSTDPLNFGLNQDRLYLVGEMPVAAPELVIDHQGQDYIAALNPKLDGVRIAKLGWTLPPKQGELVFDFESPEQRGNWQVTEGNLPAVFTQSSRSGFAAPMTHFIGTAELEGGSFDDDLTGVIESPAFRVEAPWHIAKLSGGSDSRRLYCELIDEETGGRLARFSPAVDSNTMQNHVLNTSAFVGQTVRLRVVDKGTGGWGHINFGGLYQGVVVEPSGE